MTSRELRVRFAPSPTGQLHIGGARTALFNWAYARGRGGKFVLRVEDTDRERSTSEFEAAILSGLRWLGMDWDEGPDVGGPHGPYRQREREPEHLRVADGLRERRVAYRCFCTAERLAEVRERQQAAKRKPMYDGHCRDLDPAEAQRRVDAGETCVLRFRVPEGETVFEDLIRDTVRFANREVDDWIMVRSDGAPTYNFVVVCDDAHMAITHVIRGEEHLTNTPKQLLLYDALGLERPTFAHLPLMLGTDGKKLSKRTGDTALQDYADKGFPPEAVMNFLCLQGWALDEKTEVFSLEQLVEHFDVADVSKGGSVFDIQKFEWLAGEYVRADTLERVADRCAPFVVAAGLATEAELARRRDWYLAAVATEKERITTYGELPSRIAYLFAADDFSSENALEWEPKAEENARVQGTEHLAAWLDAFRGRLVEGFDREAVAAETKAWVKERGIKFPALFQPLRCALTGAAGGPDLFEVIELLGPDRAVHRVESAVERLAAPSD